MKNRILNTLLVSACLVASAPLWGQNAAASRGIHGYLDPQSGIFHPFARMTEADVEPQATKTFTGKFVFNFTITVDSAIASTAKIACSASAVTEDNLTGGSPNIISEEASVLATRSGSTATCTVNIPYSWNLATSTTDMVTIGYSISAPAEATATTVFPTRISSQSLLAIKIPATGTTTTETITATF